MNADQKKKIMLNLSKTLTSSYTFSFELILSDMLTYPFRRMVREQNEDVHNNIVSNSMRTNRLKKFSNLHSAIFPKTINLGNLDILLMLPISSFSDLEQYFFL